MKRWKEYREESDEQNTGPLDVEYSSPEQASGPTIGEGYEITPKYSELFHSPEHTLNISEVHKTNPKSYGSGEYWRPLFREFQTSAMVEGVVKRLLSDEHPQSVTLVKVAIDRESDIVGYFKEHGLSSHQIPSIQDVQEEYIGLTRQPYTRYLGRSLYEIQNREGLYKLYVVSHDQSIAENIINVLTGNHGAFNDGWVQVMNGIGVPERCIDTQMEFAQMGKFDRVYEAACRSPSAEDAGDGTQVTLNDPNPLLNTIWSFAGLHFIDYVPCSFKDEASSEIATSFYDLLHDIGRGDEADAALTWLSLPQKWEANNGLARVENAYYIGSYPTDEYWGMKVVRLWGENEPSPSDETIFDTASREKTNEQVVDY